MHLDRRPRPGLDVDELRLFQNQWIPIREGHHARRQPLRATRAVDDEAIAFATTRDRGGLSLFDRLRIEARQAIRLPGLLFVLLVASGLETQDRYPKAHVPARR